MLCGEAGRGLQTIEQVLSRVFAAAGYHVFSTSELMSRIRGGSNSTMLRISAQLVMAPLDRIDLCVPLDKDALPHLGRAVTDRTAILADRAKVPVDRPAFDIPLAALAAAAGGPLFENTVAAGAILGLFGVAPGLVERQLSGFFAGKTPEIIAQNITAARSGYAAGAALAADGRLSCRIAADPGAGNSLLFNGAEAVGFGCLAGGCNFISSYPMSPSTSVLNFLAREGREFGVVVEQAEDEIAALNMTLGAWYAGARAMVTTSGGGFSLMTEAVSLAGMIESPAVIHLGQRPGPATGLPTRTEQGDLDLALYAGHGEFPRIIFAPGSLTQAFELARRAFAAADEYQVPVFILTDQYLLDSYALTAPFTIAGAPAMPRIVRTGADYQRYALTPDGISPRGIPGHGDGIVACDSDEHTEAGYITEDAGIRRAMVEKRRRKAGRVAATAVPPALYGSPDSAHLVLCWGSSLAAVREAVARLGRQDVSVLHFTQVFPLAPGTGELCASSRRRILVEGNATAQFGRVLEHYGRVRIDERILRYDGHPFTADGLAADLKKIIGAETSP